MTDTRTRAQRATRTRAQRAYHVTIGARRTTVSLDRVVSEYLALHLGHAPDSPGAHAAVRCWLQDELDRSGGHIEIHVSQWLLGRAVAAMVGADLAKAREDWQLDKIVPSPRTDAVPPALALG